MAELNAEVLEMNVKSLEKRVSELKTQSEEAVAAYQQAVGALGMARAILMELQRPVETAVPTPATPPAAVDNVVPFSKSATRRRREQVPPVEPPSEA